jgi:hypothetical protein
MNANIHNVKQVTGVSARTIGSAADTHLIEMTFESEDGTDSIVLFFNEQDEMHAAAKGIAMSLLGDA